MRIQFIAAAAAATVFTIPAVHAGGYVAPMIEVEPVVAPAPAAWQGAYVGATLGYAFGGDDRIGNRPPGADLGKAELSGANLGLRLGYAWQRDRWVYGPELGITGGSIKDSFDFDAGRFESKVNHMIALRLKAGYLVQDDLLVYGIAGWQRGDFTYDVAGTDVDYTANGYVVGLGIEKQLTERWSITGEYEYANFGKTDLDLPTGPLAIAGVSVATPEHSNIKLGVNYRF